MIKLAQDVQYILLQGNASNAGGTSANEGGPYNPNSFDGFRGTFGQYGSFGGNNSIQVDIGSLNILESVQSAAAKIANNGGQPTCAIMSMNTKQALDIEQNNNRRYTDATAEIVPGVRVNTIAWANGELAVIAVPGNTMGYYNRTSDGALVEDIYILDESTITMRWLYSDSWTVWQIPSGVDGVLSDRWLVFGIDETCALAQ